MGKRDSPRHSTTSISENGLVAGTSYQILEVSLFCDRERAKPSRMKVTAPIFRVKNSRMKLSGWNIFRAYSTKNLVHVVVLFLKPKAL